SPLRPAAAAAFSSEGHSSSSSESEPGPAGSGAGSARGRAPSGVPEGAGSYRGLTQNRAALPRGCGRSGAVLGLQLLLLPPRLLQDAPGQPRVHEPVPAAIPVLLFRPALRPSPRPRGRVLQDLLGQGQRRGRAGAPRPPGLGHRGGTGGRPGPHREATRGVCPRLFRGGSASSRCHWPRPFRWRRRHHGGHLRVAGAGGRGQERAADGGAVGAAAGGAGRGQAGDIRRGLRDLSHRGRPRHTGADREAHNAKANKIESRGTRYQYCDFLVKLGTVTMGPSARGISVEVEYCPCVIANDCWNLLMEFMQSFMGSHTPGIPSVFGSKHDSAYSPGDTMVQYMELFNKIRKQQQVPVAGISGSCGESLFIHREKRNSSQKQGQGFHDFKQLQERSESSLGFGSTALYPQSKHFPVKKSRNSCILLFLARSYLAFTLCS
uniref:Mediator of RNA polymerase II transcription subunit 20 n=1 Tax=Corvus moneduloides TaxID=1196302 RepID=A0A8U7P2I6_CORMO